MKVSNFKRISRSDFPEATDEFHKAMDIVSDQIELLTTALQGNISFEDNFDAEIKELDLEDNKAVTFELKTLRGKPRGVLLLDRGLFDYSVVALQVVDDKSIKVKIAMTDEAPTTSTSVRIAILGG